MAQIACTQEITGVGKLCYLRDVIREARFYIFAKSGFQFDTDADFASKTKWLEGYRDGNLFPSPPLVQVDASNFEDQNQEFPSGDKMPTVPGKRGRMSIVDAPFEKSKHLMDWNFTEFFIVDRSGNLIGTSEDGTTVKGIRIDFMEWKVKDPVTASEASKIMLELREEDRYQLEKSARIETPSTFSALADLKYGVQTVSLTLGAATNNTFTATVQYIDTTWTKDGVGVTSAITGLESANFSLVDTAGDTVAVSDIVITESATTQGEYTVNASAHTPVVETSQIMPSVDGLFKSAKVTNT